MSTTHFAFEGQRRAANEIGMAILLASWGMVFVTLLFAYAIVRTRSAVWPPLTAVAPPMDLAWFNTGVLVASSVAFHLGYRPLTRGDHESFPRWLGITLAPGVLFMILQWRLWTQMRADGLWLDTGPYGSFVAFFTIFHAAHIICALALLLALVPKALDGRFDGGNHAQVRYTGMFWHFLDIAWIAIFLAVFVL